MEADDSSGIEYQASQWTRGLATAAKCANLCEKNDENDDELSFENICDQRIFGPGSWTLGSLYYWHSRVPGGHFWPLPAGM